MISFIFPDAQDKVPRRSALGRVQTSNLGNISILAFRSQSSKFFPNLSLKVTVFDWNGNGNAEWGDHSVHAEQLSNFYRLMFSHEVCLIQSYDEISLVLVWSQDIHKECLYLSSQFIVLKMKKSNSQSELLVHKILNL